MGYAEGLGDEEGGELVAVAQDDVGPELAGERQQQVVGVVELRSGAEGGPQVVGEAAELLGDGQPALEQQPHALGGDVGVDALDAGPLMRRGRGPVCRR